MKREIVEVCPHCGEENIRMWDVRRSGYEIRCCNCHKKMMLCDECFHSDDNLGGRCDWSEKHNCFRKRSDEERKKAGKLERGSEESASLEEILQYCFGCKKPFRKEKKYMGLSEERLPIYDSMTETGHMAYGKLISAVYALETIGLITSSECERIVEGLDEIVDGKIY